MQIIIKPPGIFIAARERAIFEYLNVCPFQILNCSSQKIQKGILLSLDVGFSRRVMSEKLSVAIELVIQMILKKKEDFQDPLCKL
jgi:hypothetical protein